MNLDPHPNYGAAFRIATMRYGWLRDAVGIEDFRQAVSLAVREPDWKEGQMRRAVDRVMYALARENDFVRPSAGLPR